MTSPNALRTSAKGQAMAPPPVPFGAEAFGKTEGTVLRWLGMAGFLINSRGTTLALDAVLRVIYRIADQLLVIEVVSVVHRRDAYHS